MSAWYKSEVALADVALRDVETITEAVRAYGYPVLDLSTMSLRVEFEIGPEGIEDLWELRGFVDELRSTVESYGGRWGDDKPLPISGPSYADEVAR